MNQQKDADTGETVYVYRCGRKYRFASTQILCLVSDHNERVIALAQS